MKRFKLGSWIVEPNKSLLTSENGREVRIEPLNMALLYYFLEAPNEPIGREKLIEDVWDNKIVTDHAVYKTINQLRKYLASEGDTQEYIKTIPKKGYALVATIEEVNEVDAKEASQAKLESSSLNRIKKWFYKSPVLNTLGSLILVSILSWNLGLDTWWYQSTFKDYSQVSANNVIPGIKTEIVPSEGDRFLLVTTKRNDINENRGLSIFHQESNKHYQLLDDEYDYSRMSWSKKGNKVVVSRRTASTHLAEKCDLMILTLDAEFKKVIDQKLITKCSPQGSSSYFDDESNTLIYNYAKSEIHPASIFKLDLTTSETKILTNSGDSTYGDWSIRVSPDYSQIAYLRLYDEYNELYVLDLKTSNTKLLHSYKSFSDSISWTEDASAILYHGQGSKLWIYSLKHGFHKNIINRVDTIKASYHSRVDGKIYLVSNEVKQDVKEALIKDKSLSAVKNLTASASFEKFPSYANRSDDSVFVSNRLGSDQLFLYQNGNITQLTNRNNGGEVILTPRWSPSDEKIVYVQGGKGYLYDFATNKTELLYAKEGKTLIAFMWDNTGEKIFFSEKVNKRHEIFQIDVDSKQVKQITANGGYGGTVGPQGLYLYYVKEDHFGLWRLNLQTQEDVKIGSKMHLDSVHSLQIYPEFLTYSLTNDFLRWTSYKLDYQTLEEELVFDGNLADSRFNRTAEKIIWHEISQASNKFLLYQRPN